MFSPQCSVADHGNGFDFKSDEFRDRPGGASCFRRGTVGSRLRTERGIDSGQAAEQNYALTLPPSLPTHPCAPRHARFSHQTFECVSACAAEHEPLSLLSTVAAQRSLTAPNNNSNVDYERKQLPIACSFRAAVALPGEHS